MQYAFPAIIEPDEDGFMVTFDGVPGITWGADKEEALRQARDALITVLGHYIDRGEQIPTPPAANGRPMVAVTMLEAAKLALHDAMVVGKIRNVELGRRLGVSEMAIRRLRDPLHASKIDLVEAALRAVGWRASVEFEVA